MSQMLPVNGFKCVEDLSEFDEGFLKNYNEKSKEGYFCEVAIKILKSYMSFIIIYHFY